MKYEWDEQKRLANLQKHQLDFELASYVFEDANRLTFPDDRQDYGEERLITIGSVGDAVIIAIIHTD